MFGQTQPQSFGGNNQQLTAQAASRPPTLDEILGIKLADATLLEGFKTLHIGNYAFQVTNAEVAEYDIKQEDHPFVGTKAPRLSLDFTVIQTSGVGMNKDKQRVTEAQMQEQVGFVYKESILFGNDGLPDPKNPSVIRYQGRDRLATLISKIIGIDAYKAQVAAGVTMGNLLENLKGVKFACKVTHNVNPNDPNKRVNHQIELFGDFLQIPA